MPSSFWDWSLRAYSRPGASESLLKLQDEFGLNVNILLWCCWCAQAGAAIPELGLRKAQDLVASWSHEVTEPLRAARRALKAPPKQADAAGAEALRASVKRVELDAEKLEQAMLENLARDLTKNSEAPDAASVARRSLARYADISGAARKKGFSTLLLDDLVRVVIPDALMEALSR
ncbi:MAG: TIGR02444 family protein [Parvularculaceae bacterium]|jgi:uncharacterized protein (TIGR02444 family)|nr:TIGR02444 family protein [Parvularculaceae bacterium]